VPQLFAFYFVFAAIRYFVRVRSLVEPSVDRIPTGSLALHVALSATLCAYTWLANNYIGQCVLTGIAGVLIVAIYRQSWSRWQTPVHYRLRGTFVGHILMLGTTGIFGTWPLTLIWLWMSVGAAAHVASLNRAFEPSTWREIDRVGGRLVLGAALLFGSNVLANLITQVKLGTSLRDWFHGVGVAYLGREGSFWGLGLGASLVLALALLQTSLTGIDLMARSLAIVLRTRLAVSKDT
jgi:hypothetical protein